MKKRLFSVFMIVCLLLSLTAVGGMSAAAEDGLTVRYGTTDGSGYGEGAAVSADMIADLQNGTKALALTSSTGIPYQLYEVDTAAVSGDTVTVSLTAETVENERLALKIYNVKTSAWDTVATAVTKGQITATVAKADYTANGVLKAIVTPDFVANGSNRFLWSTDQQHYTKFDDLNQIYYDIHEYMVEEYQAGNTAYIINTGDLIDDHPNYPNAAKQWIVADKAFQILDDAGVPYGVETGNHDVGDFPMNDYRRYLQYFNASRYEGKPWFGGTADDNKCHYDLVTVGNTDFLMLYIGYGQGEDAAVLNWCNEVLAMYPHRNAIICTHQYLDPTSGARKGRGEFIHTNVVQNNDNVVMVMSGHYDGAAHRYEVIDESRSVLEVMADYQFVQKENEEFYKDALDPQHKIGGTPNCNGEGYIREVIINGDMVSFFAYSPYTDGTTPFGVRDDFTVEVDFQETTRTITVHSFTVADSAKKADYLPAVNTLTEDTTALQALVDKANTYKKDGYTAESFETFRTAVKTAQTALDNNDTEVMSSVYAQLGTAIGMLTEEVEEIHREYLTTVIDLDLDVTAWENSDGVSNLLSPSSHVSFENLEDGGFVAKKGTLAPNGWPQMKYSAPIIFTPEDGKVYLYLDLEADSAWSIYPVVIQGDKQYMGRWNYVIEDTWLETLDAGVGTYKGVYNVTEALVALGVNMEEKMILTFALNVVPGPVTVNAISVLTGEYAPPAEETAGGMGAFFDTYGLWLILAAVVVLGAVAIVIAVTYKPQKATDSHASDHNT